MVLEVLNLHKMQLMKRFQSSQFIHNEPICCVDLCVRLNFVASFCGTQHTMYECSKLYWKTSNRPERKWRRRVRTDFNSYLLSGGCPKRFQGQPNNPTTQPPQHYWRGFGTSPNLEPPVAQTIAEPKEGPARSFQLITLRRLTIKSEPSSVKIRSRFPKAIPGLADSVQPVTKEDLSHCSWRS